MRTDAYQLQELHDRFQRQLSLPGFGTAGQTTLHKSSVLVVGLGAVGSLAAVYLARAGVGRLGIVDFDVVALSNLHRQPFYCGHDVGQSKVDVVATRLREAGMDLRLETYASKADHSFLAENLSKYDIVVDAVDNFDGKLAINDTAWNARIPFVSGAVEEYAGQVLTVAPIHSPCLRCIVPQVPDEQNASPAVFPPIAAIIGAVTASEVLKLLLRVGEPLIGRLLLVQATDWATTVLPVEKRPGCMTCGRSP